MNEANPSAVASVLNGLRLLKWDELVRRGDFVEDGHDGFEPWVGPSGFRADAFVKKIFRQAGRPPIRAKKSK